MRGFDKVKYSELKDNFSVLIPDGKSIFALSVLRCLSEVPGLRTYVLSDNPKAPVRFSKYTSQFLNRAKGLNDKKTIDAIRLAVKQTKADVILPVEEKTIRLLSLHRSKFLKLTALAPLADCKTFDIASDKYLLAEFLKQNNIPCPTTIRYQPNSGFDSHLPELTFPVIIKPAIGGYGKGIRTFNNLSELLCFFEKHECSDNYIVQSFINGFDIDCSVVCQDGNILAYTIQKGFLEGYHPFGAPSGIDFIHDDSTLDVVKDLVGKLKWSGIAHIDLRYDEEARQVKVIEINPRFWGSLLGSLNAGVNFLYLACLVGLGINLPQINYQLKRFVAGKAALQIINQHFGLKKKNGLSINSSSIAYIMRDPLPELYESILYAFKKIRHKIH